MVIHYSQGGPVGGGQEVPQPLPPHTPAPRPMAESTEVVVLGTHPKAWNRARKPVAFVNSGVCYIACDADSGYHSASSNLIRRELLDRKILDPEIHARALYGLVRINVEMKGPTKWFHICPNEDHSENLVADSLVRLGAISRERIRFTRDGFGSQI